MAGTGGELIWAGEPWLGCNWDYLKLQHNLPDDIVPVDIAEVATWFFEEDATDYRDYREDFPAALQERDGGGLAGDAGEGGEEAAGARDPGRAVQDAR